MYSNAAVNLSILLQTNPPNEENQSAISPTIDPLYEETYHPPLSGLTPSPTTTTTTTTTYSTGTVQENDRGTARGTDIPISLGERERSAEEEEVLSVLHRKWRLS